MGMFNFVLDSFKGEIFDFKVHRRVLVASTVCMKGNPASGILNELSDCILYRQTNGTL